MTGEIVNLRRARKRQARLADEARASERRAAFGASNAEEGAVTVLRSRSASFLDQHRLDRSRAGEPDGQVGPLDG